MIPILSGNVASALPSGYDVDNSLRFNGADSARLSIANPTAGNRKTGSISFWIKLCDLNANHNIYNTYNSSASGYSSAFIQVTTAGRIEIVNYQASGGSHSHLGTNRLLRDFSAWYHCLCVWDTTQSSSSDRLKIYINGTQETSFATAVYPSLNEDLFFDIGGTSNPRYIGYAFTAYMDAYLAEMFYVNGTALTPSSFGEFDEDTPTIWKPKDCKNDLTFGDEGFYLDFEDSSNLGLDTSGNSNNFTVTNLAATDQSTDTCTNNFATFNPLDKTSNGTDFVLSEGNLKGVTAVDTTGALQSTIAVSSGKWYAEFKVTNVGSNLSGGRTTVGIGSRTNAQVSGNFYGNTASPIDSYGKYSASGVYYHNNGTSVSYGSSFVNNDIIGVYLDLDNNKLYFSENGTLYSSTGIDITAAASTLNGHYHIGFSDASANDNGEVEANYGGCSAFTISSAVSDDNGYGSFEYSPNITGDGEAKKFYALCTKNLAEFG